ncbi:uncharacterized protein [Ptychodera flava]|uniref:uncharacterized protein isoform X1 n=1 Tax=Ptychodera flava TaxID=63121 RepID=UPI00396A55B8
MKLLSVIIVALAFSTASAIPVNIAIMKDIMGPGIDHRSANDGDVNTCRMSPKVKDSYLKIDLKKQYDIKTVKLLLNPDAPRNYEDTVIRAGNKRNWKDNPICARINLRPAPLVVERACEVKARYVIIQKMGKKKRTVSGLCEFQIFTDDGTTKPIIEPPPPPPPATTALPTPPPPPAKTPAPPTVAPIVTTAAPVVEKTAIPTTLGKTNPPPPPPPPPPANTPAPNVVKTSCELPEALINLAEGKSARQSSTKCKSELGAEKAVDGNKDSDLRNGASCTKTEREFQPWWQVDLESSHDIYSVVITNRQDCCSFRIENAEVRIGNREKITDNAVCGEIVNEELAGSEIITITCGCEVPMSGRYVSIQLVEKTQVLHLCEVEVMGI